MKKLAIMLLFAAILITLLLIGMPAEPVMANWPGAPCGAVGGDPPGWSQVSRGAGGSSSPGIGPGAP